MTTILLIEGNIDDARRIGELLKEAGRGAYQLIHYASISEATELLRGKRKIDVILADIVLPDSRGLHTLNRLRRVAANLPVVFFTDMQDERLARAALQKGAQDYIIKGQFDSEALARAIRYAIERKKFHDDLQRIKLKTRALQEKTRLLKAQSAQLRALSEAKDDFISLASHQLRTPATGVKQYIGMLREGFAGRLTLQQKNLLNVAYESNERQLHIVDDLLKVAQVDAGQLSLKKRRSDMVALTRRVLEEHRPSFEQRRQALRLQASQPAIYATIDPERMRMVLDNLLENASNYSPEGQPVTVALSQRNATIRLSVKDRGVGIAKSNQSKVFQKFTRIRNPLSANVGGSGLGLYWVKKVVDLHGGSVKLVSALGKGTTVIIELPGTA